MNKPWTRSLLAALLMVWPTVAGCDCGELLFFGSEADGGESQDDGGGSDAERSALVDVLLIIDNSGSMCEEHALLVDSFFDPACPIENLLNPGDEFANVDDEQLETLSEQCGFIQLLAAVGIDARVGIASTDVGECDNRFGFASDPAFPDSLRCGRPADPSWGRRPQRGCLMGTPEDNVRFVQTGDADVQAHFADMVRATGIFGSPFERGLDQVEAFLSHDRAEGCPAGATEFLRADADLLVILMSDEEDCSHGGDATFPDENAGESCANAGEPPYSVRVPPVAPADCYADPGALRGTDLTASFLARWSEDEAKAVTVASISGGVYIAGQDAIEPAGCVVDENGKPDEACTPSQGNSNDPAACPEDATPPCCTADPGARYQTLVDEVGGGGLNDSICYSSYRDTLLDVARLAASAGD